MASSNRSHSHSQWPSGVYVDDTSTFPVIPPDTNTTSSTTTDSSASLLSSSSISLDVSQIDGNVTEQSKRRVMEILRYYYAPGIKEESFGLQVGRRLSMKSMNVWANSRGVSGGTSLEQDPTRVPKRATEAQTVFEITVAKDMCNPYGTLHGACACYIVDPCSMSAIVVLGAALGVDATGVSQSMNLIWHQPAKMGTKLRVVSNSIFIEGRIRTARVEIMDSETDKLYVSAIHSTINPSPPPGGSHPASKL